MCGRVTVKSTPKELQEAFKLAGIVAAPEHPNYNLPPTVEIPAVVNDGRRELDMLRWGLVPSWAKDLKSGPLLNNARAETVAEKRTFRSALERRRCVILADGFYEWRREGKLKTPFLIRRRDGQPLAFAGLWDTWRSPDHHHLRSCTVLTCGPNDTMRPIHDRMPVILDAAGFDRWLSPDPTTPEAVSGLLVPCPPEVLETVQVSAFVNSVRNNGPECMAPVATA